MEMIEYIISEMRKVMPRGVEVETILRHYADRIEKAAKTLEADRDNWRKQALAEDERANAGQPETNCNGLKMREAIYGIKNNANSALTALSIGNCPSSFLWDIVRKCEAALSAPPRNCDLYPKDEVRLAYHLHGDGLMTMQAFADWLFEQAKGETK